MSWEETICPDPGQVVQHRVCHSCAIFHEDITTLTVPMIGPTLCLFQKFSASFGIQSLVLGSLHWRTYPIIFTDDPQEHNLGWVHVLHHEIDLVQLGKLWSH